jgi:hypothetical protein
MATLKGLTLSLLIGPGLPVPAPAEVVDALVSAQVTVAAGQRSGFQLAFTVGKRSLLASTLLPAGYLDPLVRVVLVATVNGVPNVLMDGAVTRQDLTAADRPGEQRLTVTGEDISHYMGLVELTGLPYPGQDETVQVLGILARYAWLGVIPAPVPPLWLDVPIPIDKIPAQDGTDYAYLEQLARRHGYVFYIEPGPLPGASVAYWGPEIRVGPPQPALSVNMDAHSNVESLSFAYDGSVATLYYAYITEPLSKATVPVPIPDIGILKPPLSLRPAVPAKVEQLKASGLSVLQTLARGVGAQGRAGDPITATGRLDVLRYGRVLQARRLVAVRGAGKAHDGLYYVKSVTHDLKRGEYKQGFTLVRDGLISNLPRVPV